MRNIRKRQLTFLGNIMRKEVLENLILTDRLKVRQREEKTTHKLSGELERIDGGSELWRYVKRIKVIKSYKGVEVVRHTGGTQYIEERQCFPSANVTSF